MLDMLNDKAIRHIDTAVLLAEGLSEAKDEILKEHYVLYSSPPEYSKESIKRRCIQIRQELLMVIKELDS